MGGGIHTKEEHAAASAALRLASASAALRAASASAALRAASACAAAATRAAAASCSDTTGERGGGRTTPHRQPHQRLHDPRGSRSASQHRAGFVGCWLRHKRTGFSFAGVQTQASGTRARTLRPQAIAGVHSLPAQAEPKPYTPLRHEGLPPPPAHAGEPLPDGTATCRATQATTGSVRTHARIMHSTNHSTRARTAATTYCSDNTLHADAAYPRMERTKHTPIHTHGYSTAHPTMGVAHTLSRTGSHITTLQIQYKQSRDASPRYSP
jgi:hypothetical protein